MPLIMPARWRIKIAKKQAIVQINVLNPKKQVLVLRISMLITDTDDKELILKKKSYISYLVQFYKYQE